LARSFPAHRVVRNSVPTWRHRAPRHAGAHRVRHWTHAGVPDARVSPRRGEPPMTEPVRLSPGDAAPPFELPDQDGTSRRLADYAGGRVILYVYPAAMTPGCTTEAC